MIYEFLLFFPGWFPQLLFVFVECHLQSLRPQMTPPPFRWLAPAPRAPGGAGCAPSPGGARFRGGPQRVFGMCLEKEGPKCWMEELREWMRRTGVLARMDERPTISTSRWDSTSKSGTAAVSTRCIRDHLAWETSNTVEVEREVNEELRLPARRRDGTGVTGGRDVFLPHRPVGCTEYVRSLGGFHTPRASCPSADGVRGVLSGEQCGVVGNCDRKQLGRLL